MTNEIPEALKPFEFHGVEFSVNGTANAVADCPFCGKHKFFANKDNGAWDCKVCGKSGNVYTFLGYVHSQWMEQTTDKQLERLSKARGEIFSAKFLREAGVAVDNLGNAIFPCKKPSNKNPSNIRRWSPKKRISYNTSGCCSLFYVSDWLDVGPIYICEGEWDALALKLLFQRAKQSIPTIVAVPGAGVFKEAWLKNFLGRDLILLYDHDEAGTNGMKKLIDKFVEADKKSGKATFIQRIDWSKYKSDLESGYDLRDYVTEAIEAKKSKLYLKQLHGLLDTGNDALSTSVPIVERTSFEDVVTDFRNMFEWNQSFTDSLTCCIAAIVSLRLGGNPLWFHIVAPASSGKTTIIEAFEAAHTWSYHLSRVKDTSLVSGFMGTGDDPSLLPKLHNKTLFVKDFTPILSMGISEKDRLFGILRDAYDGRYVQTYGTGQKRAYDNLHFGMVTGVTLAIHSENRSNLGERFLKINLLGNDFDHDAHILKALENDASKTSNRLLIQGSIVGFLKHLDSLPFEVVYPEIYLKRLTALSQLVAYIRTSVDRGAGRDMSYRPHVEVGSRIATQLRKLGITTAFIHGKKEVDEDCYRLMQKVAMDSCVGWHFDLIRGLDSEPIGLTTSEVAHKMQMHPNQVKRVIEDAIQIGTISISKQSHGRSYRYELCRKIKRLIRKAKLEFNQLTTVTARTAQ